nr:MAG TPA: hypothetical protein [Caudoviricetes sp.]DAI38210.1 MAG TPA: hypothetical protein [Caudoviricetes sp.]
MDKLKMLRRTIRYMKTNTNVIKVKKRNYGNNRRNSN